MASEPERNLDGDDYNRIRFPNSLKSQILMGINDSSESLPLDSDDEDEGDFKTAPKDQVPAVAAGATKPSALPSRSGLSQSVLSSDIATPTPERPNPLEQVPTAVQNPVTGSQPSPVISHEREPTHMTPIAPRAQQLISEEDSELEGPGDSMSRQTTASIDSKDGKRPKLGGRPSTMRRITSALKRTVTKDKDGKD